jgi:nucleotide-binding universal stress UspA family protein
MVVTTVSPGLETNDRAELEAHARRIHGCQTTSVVLDSNDPVDDLTEFAQRHPHALICLATHARTAIGELVFGSMTDDLLRRVARPILAIGPSVDPTSAPSDNLLVAVDAFTLKTSLPAAVGTWQASFGGTVELVEAVVPRTNAEAVARPTELGQMSSVFPDARLTTVESRDPARAIIDVAAESRSVIAVATHLHHGLDRIILGSVAWEVVRYSPTPVLIVPALP